MDLKGCKNFPKKENPNIITFDDARILFVLYAFVLFFLIAMIEEEKTKTQTKGEA